jgi:hypothetical protein
MEAAAFILCGFQLPRQEYRKNIDILKISAKKPFD